MVSLAGLKSQSGGFPVGSLLPSGQSASPPGYLPCDGAAVSRAVYADLFTAIGTSFGVGDGSTTFNVPNTSGLLLRGDGSQVISSKTFNGGVIGNKQKDATAVNGLTASTVSTPTLSLADADLTHTHTYNDLTTSFITQVLAIGAAVEGIWQSVGGFNATELDNTVSALGAHNHGVTPSITSVVTTLSSSATETRPACLTVAYHIKY